MNRPRIRQLILYFFGTALLFWAINGIYRRYHAAREVPGPISLYGMSKLTLAYPGWTKDQIKSLLSETYSRPLRYEPFTEITEKPFRGTYVNVHESGFRFVENQGSWPPSSENINIFFFGSSTAFGYGVKDGDTIASQLQTFLNEAPQIGKTICVYNFGRGFYSSTNERILFSQLLEKGYAPDVAVFLDGLTDSKWMGEDGTQLSSEIASVLNNPFKALFLEIERGLEDLPVIELARRIQQRLARFMPAQPKVASREEKPTLEFGEVLPVVLRRWNANRLMIEGMCRRYGIKPLFVWQPVPVYKYDLNKHPFFSSLGRIYVAPVYSAMERQLTLLNSEKDFLWLADLGENREEVLYCDAYHYTGAFSKDIARAIGRRLLTDNYLHSNGGDLADASPALADAF